MSVLRTAYTNLAAMAVTVNGYTYPCHDLHELKDTYDEVDCKRRILLPWEARGNDGEFGFLTIDRTASVTWRMIDLMLYSTVQLYAGIKDVAPTLVEYAGEYAEVIRGNRTLAKTLTNNLALTGIGIQIGVFDYPLGSQTFYVGVKATLTVKETMTQC